MAPEVLDNVFVRGSSPYGRSCDIYSYGGAPAKRAKTSSRAATSYAARAKPGFVQHPSGVKRGEGGGNCRRLADIAPSEGIIKARPPETGAHCD